MQAWLCESLDGVDALKWRELPTPEPKAGEVRIAIHAASLNFPDSLTIVGKYQFKPELPFVPGFGILRPHRCARRRRHGVQVGDAVVGIASSGGFGSHAVMPAARVLPLPPGLGPINYSQASLRDALKAATDGKGPDVIYDPVGGDLAEPALRSIAWRGRYLVIGFAAGGIPALPWNLPLLKGASIVGVFWGEFARREPRAFAAGMAQRDAPRPTWRRASLDGGPLR
ncbi:MAG: zinc-binding dehydrogenase [Rubrivivax sp.]|nr:zinc-binding dehydrogenase [Rubrivivax sp.]